MHDVVAWLTWSHASNLAHKVVTVAGELIAGELIAGELIAGVDNAVPWVAGGPRRSS
jgi:hypothetical protein